MNEWAIDVRGLTKIYDNKTVVDSVDLKVKKGSICGFLGPNGSGKTTTIRMLCGLLSADAGAGTCLGLDLKTQGHKIKRKVGYMTQKFGLYEDLTIRQNLDFVARLFEINNRHEVVSEALVNLGLESRQNQLAGSLSGGWKQRLSLAACLIHEPELLLLDEPTAGVDPKARRDFWDQIHTLAAKGITVLVSTHYMDEAERCHELIYIAYGKILTRGTEQEIIKEANLQVRSIQGNSLIEISSYLKNCEGILSVAAFGNSLHVTARESKALDNAIQSIEHPEALIISPVHANLEDIFISLIATAKDNYGQEKL